MTARKIPLMIPEDAWGSLATLADRRHTDVSTLINQAISEWLIHQGDDLRVRRLRRRGHAPGSPLDVLAEELYATRKEHARG